jgi:UPF0755 protein
MYSLQNHKRRWPLRVVITGAVLLVLIIVGTVSARVYYDRNLRPVDGESTVHYVTIKPGTSLPNIAMQLKREGLIRSAQAFEWYIDVHNQRGKLQAGTYELNTSESVASIADKLAHGQVATSLVTIVPGVRIDQVRDVFVKAGYSADTVVAALDPAQYATSPALSDKPAGASLEGFLYPDSFQKDTNTTPTQIISESLAEMETHLTPDVRASFARQGLSVYQGVTLASIIEQEVSKPSDRAQVAQVFLKRLHSDMPLGSDVTAFYGARVNGQKPSLQYDSQYNTLLHKGLPPGPISNVSESSLQAIAHPANTDWLFFVAGDNGNTYFSKTLEEHQQLTQQYCHKLCSATE